MDFTLRPKAKLIKNFCTKEAELQAVISDDISTQQDLEGAMNAVTRAYQSLEKLYDQAELELRAVANEPNSVDKLE